MELSFFNNSRSVEMVQSFLQKGALHDMSYLQVRGLFCCSCTSPLCGGSNSRGWGFSCSLLCGHHGGVSQAKAFRWLSVVQHVPCIQILYPHALCLQPVLMYHDEC
jgi:hypothetical protein